MVLRRSRCCRCGRSSAWGLRWVWAGRNRAAATSRRRRCGPQGIPTGKGRAGSRGPTPRGPWWRWGREGVQRWKEARLWHCNWGQRSCAAGRGRLQRELDKKEKALTEAATLLMLSKKFNKGAADGAEGCSSMRLVLAGPVTSGRIRPYRPAATAPATAAGWRRWGWPPQPSTTRRGGRHGYAAGEAWRVHRRWGPRPLRRQGPG